MNLKMMKLILKKKIRIIEKQDDFPVFLLFFCFYVMARLIINVNIYYSMVLFGI